MKKSYSSGYVLIKNPQVKYHRNGIGGEGFYVVAFDWDAEAHGPRKMVATVFNAKETGSITTAVLDRLEPLEAWRGDHFHLALIAAIRDFQVSTYGHEIND